MAFVDQFLAGVKALDPSPSSGFSHRTQCPRPASGARAELARVANRGQAAQDGQLISLNWQDEQTSPPKGVVSDGSILSVGLALFAVMIGAIIRWPDKTVADVAFPTAFLIAAVLAFEGAEFNPDQIAAHA